ncbi:AAA family ATPase [Nonomuraea sp. NPDC049695]|uniref:AAA family ATPase n=1 Tax=Nonomuraea sp. NPDC049695 TaxID=3154734 RepID=UPI0034152F61
MSMDAGMARREDGIAPRAIGVGLRKIAAELSQLYFERDLVVRGLLSAVLASQHALLLGPPGTAKSELARELTSRFSGSAFWEILLSPFTDPKRMFGPVDVGALTRGQYRQLFDGRATTCDIAFIDEIFKCGSGALNELLAFLNERVYHPEAGGAPIACPLLSAITASNELGEEDTAAVYDRLLVRLQVGYLVEKDNFAALLRSATAGPPATPVTRTKIPLSGLKEAIAVHVPAVELGADIVEALCVLRATLSKEGVIASDRRWKASARLLQAAAYLAGRPAVTEADLPILTTVLWDRPDQRDLVDKCVLNLASPDTGELLEWEEEIATIEAEIAGQAGRSRTAMTTWAKQARTKLDKAGRRLNDIQAEASRAGRSTAAVERVLRSHSAVTQRVLDEVLGIAATAASPTRAGK